MIIFFQASYWNAQNNKDSTKEILENLGYGWIKTARYHFWVKEYEVINLSKNRAVRMSKVIKVKADWRNGCWNCSSQGTCSKTCNFFFSVKKICRNKHTIWKGRQLQERNFDINQVIFLKAKEQWFIFSSTVCGKNIPNYLWE